MFDGTVKLVAKDFDVKSNQSPALTGKGGKVSDLKASDPDIKTFPIPELSLSGTKLSGETPGQAATKQSAILLASASSAKSPADTAASAKTAVSATAKASAVSIDPNYAGCFCSVGGTFHGTDEALDLAACEALCCKEEGLLCLPDGCGQYDSTKSCCINGKVVEKFKAPKKPLIGAIRDCNNRVQAVSPTVVAPGKEGCSVNKAVEFLINLKEMRIFPLNIINKKTIIIDFNNPFNDPKLAFRGSCNTHDWCYGTCMKNVNDFADRKKCDDQLLENLKRVCKNAEDDKPIWDACYELAGDIYGGLRQNIIPFSGPGVYRDAQIQHCKCDLCP
ncbi:MAG: hypothetical protein HY796_04190 [Elusimicrobia bacterium]|nr:hypothetical protein [Elusimicrobiota bacterium]